MAQTSWNKPGSALSVTKSGGTVSWTGVGSAYASDNAYVTAAIASNSTHWLRCTHFGYTTSDIPDTATIDGLEVRYEGKSTIGGAGEPTIGPLLTFSAVKAMASGGSSIIYPEAWAVGEATSRAYGSSAVLSIWSTTFTATEAISASSGVNIAYFDDSATSVSLFLDTLEIRWTYTAAGGTNNGGSFFGLYA